MLRMGIDSLICATHGGTPQFPGGRAQEFRRRGPSPLYYSPGLHQCAGRLVSGVDVIHGHGLYVGTNFLFGREAQRQRKPLVYHVHGMFEPYILRRSRWKKRLVGWLFEERNFRHARLWRALTSKEADQIRACGITGPVVVVPNGIDPGTFDPDGTSDLTPIETPWVPCLTKTRRRLLFLGRIHPKKGFDLLLPAWAALGGLGEEWELVVAGPDEQGYLARVRGLAASCGLAERVLFTGPVSGAAKRALLQSANLFVLPSHSEGFPMAILEALASGVPVVATSACNFPDLGTAGAGWECAADVESLRGVLEVAVRSSDAELRERGLRGRALVASRYSWPALVRDLAAACETHC